MSTDKYSMKTGGKNEAGPSMDKDKRTAPESSLEISEPIPKRRRTIVKRAVQQEVRPIDVPPQVITFEMGHVLVSSHTSLSGGIMEVQVIEPSVHEDAAAERSAPPSTEVAGSVEQRSPLVEAEVIEDVTAAVAEETAQGPSKSTSVEEINVLGSPDSGAVAGQRAAPSTQGLKFKPFSFAKAPKLKITRSQRYVCVLQSTYCRSMYH